MFYGFHVFYQKGSNVFTTLQDLERLIRGVP